MDRQTGLDAQQTNMDVIANNPANVSTNGFKRQRAVFEDLLYQTIRQPGHSLPNKPPYHPDYKSVRGTPGRHGTFTQPGNLSQTNNSKDVAIKGQGFSSDVARWLISLYP